MRRRARRRGFSVALIGPDGAGKTTVARSLESELPLDMTYLYMGVSQESSGRLLPTTRIVRALRRRRGEVERGPRPVARPDAVRRPTMRSRVRAALRTTNRIAEESYRQLLAWREMRAGRVVVFDRHFYADYYIHDVVDRTGLPMSRRIHGFFLSRVLPRPDLIVYLDAPAEVLFARKGEGSVEILEQMREGYLRLGESAARFVVVDVDRAVGLVVPDVVDAVLGFDSERSSRYFK
ncbi:MAG: hypothetical protein ACE5GB_11220 [Acidimicrobiales bacterium]